MNFVLRFLVFRSGHGKVVEILLKNGANVNARDKNENTPIHAAAHQGKLLLN